MTRHQARVVHCWGMTELSPLGSVAALLPEMEEWPLERQLDVLSMQGRSVYGVELKVTDDVGVDLPHDGKSAGHLKARGPWVASAYFKGAGASSFDPTGWFDSGDIATIDDRGYVRLTDRAKDLIKSGGEWISSVDLENALMAHPAVAQAAVIAVPDPKWDERPLGVLVLVAGASAPDHAELTAFLAPRFAKWWLPDAYEVVAAIPIGATGKFLKRELRDQFTAYQGGGTAER